MNKIFLGIIGINSNYENPYITLLINFSFFIFLLVNIPLAYGIYNIFILKTVEQTLQCLMSCNDIIILLNFKLSNKSLFIENFYHEDINPNIKDKIINPVLVICFILSFILSIVYSVLSGYNYNFLLIDQLTQNNYLKYLITFFYTFYSSCIRLYCCVIFFSVFFTIKTYLNDCKDIILKEEFNIITICEHFLEIKHKYSKAVNKLNFILSTNIICNFLSVHFLIIKVFENEYLDLLTVRSSIYFLISVLTFHFILADISNNTDSIKSLIDNNKYIRLFLSRKKESYQLNIELSELNSYNPNQLNLKNYLLGIENGDSIDWMILNNIINQNWKPFEILGFEISNKDIVFKLFSLLVLLWIGNEII